MSKTSLPTEDTFSALETPETKEVTPSQGSFMARLAPKFVRDARDEWKRGGFRAVIKRYGWKAFAAFFLYYLIRDSFLYILLPYVIARGLF